MINGALYSNVFPPEIDVSAPLAQMTRELR